VSADDVLLTTEVQSEEDTAVSDGSVTFDQYVSADDVLLTTEVQSEEDTAVLDSSVTFDQYVSADDVLLTTEVQSEEDTAATCNRNNEDSDGDDENDDTSESDQLCAATVSVSRVQAITAMDTLLSFTESMPEVPDTVFDAIPCNHDFAHNTQARVTQVTITHFSRRVILPTLTV